MKGCREWSQWVTEGGCGGWSRRVMGWLQRVAEWSWRMVIEDPRGWSHRGVMEGHRGWWGKIRVLS